MAERAKSKGRRRNGNGQSTLPLSGKKKRSSRGVGDNSGGDVPTEVYERHLGVISTRRNAMQRAQETAKQRTGEYRSALRAAKEDGCNTDAMLLAHKLDKMDPIEVALLYRDTGRVLRLDESKLATQLNLFADVAAPAPENPVLAGEAAGKRGDPRESNPHLPGSNDYVLYDSAWQQGQESIAATLGRG